MMWMIGAFLEQKADASRTLMPTELVLRLELSGKLSISRRRVKADRQRLLFDGQRITEDQTAADLELEDGDALEVLLERKSNRLVETYSLDRPHGIFADILQRSVGVRWYRGDFIEHVKVSIQSNR
jgi:hypothetical protein